MKVLKFIKMVKNMKKQLPNFFSCVRIIGATILLIFFDDFTVPFLIIYGISAATDAVDGYLARKFDCCSMLGVTLDTIGDLLIGMTPVKVIIWQKLYEGNLWFFGLIGAAIFFFLCSATLSQIKFKKFTFPHTYFDKLLGVCVAASPFIYYFTKDIKILFIVVGVVFALCGFENFLIMTRLKKAVPFVPSIFHAGKMHLIEEDKEEIKK